MRLPTPALHALSALAALVGAAMLVSHRKAGANTAHLFRVAAPMAQAEQLTDGIDPVSRASYDPRVPCTEAEQIVAKVREGGTPAWYLRAENEGHGFQKKENQDFHVYATVLFMRQTVSR